MLKYGDYTGYVVYGRNVKNGKHVGVKRLQIYSYISTYKVYVFDIDRTDQSVYKMDTWDLYHTWGEASPRKAKKKKKKNKSPYWNADTVAEKCIKHIKVFFNQSEGGLYGR